MGLAPEGELEDKRRCKRVEMPLRCWCEGGQVTFYARLVNLSEGGLFLRTRTPLQQGSHARVRFRGRDSDEEIQADATVIWIRDSQSDRPPGMGMKFDRPDAKMLDGIRRIMQGEQRL